MSFLHLLRCYLTLNSVVASKLTVSSNTHILTNTADLRTYIVSTAYLIDFQVFSQIEKSSIILSKQSSEMPVTRFQSQAVPSEYSGHRGIRDSEYRLLEITFQLQKVKGIMFNPFKKYALNWTFGQNPDRDTIGTVLSARKAVAGPFAEISKTFEVALKSNQLYRKGQDSLDLILRVYNDNEKEALANGKYMQSIVVLDTIIKSMIQMNEEERSHLICFDSNTKLSAFVDISIGLKSDITAENDDIFHHFDCFESFDGREMEERKESGSQRLLRRIKSTAQSSLGRSRSCGNLN